MDVALAQARLERMVSSAVDPILNSTTITDLLVYGRRPDAAGNDTRNTSAASSWTAATLYQVNDLVRQSGSVERWWVCETPGTSAATAPVWPVFTYGRLSTSIVTDGSAVWRDAGSRWQPTYDFNAMAAAGWEVKAALIANRFTFAADGQTFNRSQQHAMCLTMADRYRNRRSGTVSTGII